MKKKFIAGLTSVAMIGTTLLTNSAVFAADSFATAGDLIEDVLVTAVSDLEIADIDTAIDTAMANITVEGSKVSYNDTTLGYWSVANDSTMYSDAEMSKENIAKTGSGYVVDPTLLGTLLTNVNESIVSTYIPTTTDWSKIIGKYDVTLGDTKIPTKNWLSFKDGEAYNFTRNTGIGNSYFSDTSKQLTMFTYLINDEGELFISKGIRTVKRGYSGYACNIDYTFQNTKGVFSTSAPCWDIRDYNSNSTSQISFSSYPNGMYDLDVTGSLTSYTKDDFDTVVDVYPVLKYSATAAKEYVWNYSFLGNNGYTTEMGTMLSQDDPSIVNTTPLSQAEDYGIVYLTEQDFALTAAKFDAFFTTVVADKTTVGNTKLSTLIRKFSGLTTENVLTISTTEDWIVDGEDFETVTNSQTITNAGETAEMNAEADIEALAFNVVVPTILPIYVDDNGIVSVATNASVTNKSSIGVKLTDIAISAKDDSGWTLTDNPSTQPNAKEFSFVTSLENGAAIPKDGNLPFTYNVAISPSTEGISALDIASVQLTVDWDI